MRVTRYVWISNLPPRVNEQDIRDVLQRYICSKQGYLKIWKYYCEFHFYFVINLMLVFCGLKKQYFNVWFLFSVMAKFRVCVFMNGLAVELL